MKVRENGTVLGQGQCHFGVGACLGLCIGQKSEDRSFWFSKGLEERIQ